MDRNMQKEIVLALAIIDLALGFALFTGVQYLSEAAMIAILILPVISLILFLAPSIWEEKKLKIVNISAIVVSVIVIVYEYLYILLPSSFIAFSAYVLARTSFAAIISIGGIILIKKFESIKLVHKKGCITIVIVIFLVILSAAAYESMYYKNSNSWNGVDEIAYNYYAAYLFMHGTNPYASSMQPIIQKYNIAPTLLLNGSYEYRYSYPALSFLAYIWMPLLGISSFYAFVFVVILISIIAAYTVYSKYGRSLLPLFVWLVATYIFVGVANTYLSIAFFVFLAYEFRNKKIIPGVLLGLAISTMQLAWFALPFMLLLFYMDQGKKKVENIIITAIMVFIAVNAYFIISSPKQFEWVFGLMGLDKLVFYGLNIMQFFVLFFQMPMWYLVFISVLVALISIILLVLYPEKKAIAGIAPAFIFFLSWRNIIVYSLPFVPIILSIYEEQSRLQNITKQVYKIRQRYVASAVLILLIIIVITGIYAHGLYLFNQKFRIGKAMPVMFPIQLQGKNYSEVRYMYIVINSSRAQNISFIFQSRSPNEFAYSPAFVLKNYSASNKYIIDFYIPITDRTTKLAVIAFSKDYIARPYIINFANFTN
ncbi:MAG: hypothetical protein ACP5RP_00580 [Candidatus Micrarchaeia archaeon]